MPYNDEISIRQTAMNNATLTMQTTMKNFSEPQDADKILEKTFELADKITEYIENGRGNATPSPSDDTLLYVAVSKKNKNPEEYAEAFRKYDFREGNKGGYWANIPASELFKMFNEYRGIDKELRFTIQKSEKGEK